MDRLRKVIYIIVGTLTAILLTFSLMKRIGLCAEPVKVPTPTYPTVCYANLSPFTDAQIQQIIQAQEEIYFGNKNDKYFMQIIDYTETYYIVRFVYWTDTLTLRKTDVNYIDSGTYEDGLQQLNTEGQVKLFGYKKALAVKVMKDFSSITDYDTWLGGSYVFTIYTDNLYLNEPNTSYPFYCSQPFYLNNNGTQVLWLTGNGNIPTHTKGGVIAEMTENDDIIGEELPQIDTSAPSTDTNTNWFQKILNALGGIGKRIQNTTLTTGWYLNEIKDGNRNFFLDITALLGTALPSITEKLDAIIGYNREQAQENKDDWIEGYQTSAIKSIADTGHSYRETLSQIGQRNTNRLVFGVWRLEYNGNDLHLIGNYTMPQIFSGQTVQQDISFAWYNQVRDYVVRVFKVLLYVGFSWYLLTQVPNMIKGASGPARKIGDESK